jgi:hypothetical protein
MTTHIGPGARPRGLAVLARVLDLLAGLAKLVGAIFAVLLVGHILLTFFDAAPGNAVTKFFASAADNLVLWFQGLFSAAEPKVTVLVNYGIAAIFWLVAAAVVAHVLRSLAGPARG